MPVSDFSTGLEGWTVTNGTEIYDALVGNPDGSLRGVEGGSGVWYFDAPASFLGDMSAFYGGSLTFDLRQDGDSSQFDDEDVILTGGGLTLALDFGPNPGMDWTSYSVSMALGGGWKIDSVSGRVATEEEIRTVLGSLDSLQIRGEFVNGSTNDASNIDNIALTESPVIPDPFVGPRIQSTFDDGVDGWSFIADVREFRAVADGGNPGGYIEAVDYTTGQIWYFAAADKFLGDKSAYAGGRLQFDLKQSSLSSQIDYEDVIIEGGGLTIALDTPTNPGLDWTSYAVFLDTRSDWRLDDLSGAAASLAEINQVLSNVTALYIRGEFVSGSDTGGLDNVVMSPENAPVRLLADATTGYLLSSHDTLTEALAVASLGNVIQIADATAAPLPAYTISVNGLTIQSDAALSAQLNLDGVSSITLAGSNDLNVNGNTGANTIVGSDGDNTINGLLGRDELFGGRGNDTLNGGAGIDILNGGFGADILLGGQSADRLIGDQGDDELFGQAGRDTLRGGNGADLLVGGAGNDVMTGGAREDTFRFEDGFGTDVIRRFSADLAGEVIDLSAVTAILNFADLALNHMDQVGSDVVIDDLAGNTIRLIGVDIGDLGADSFLF